MADSLEASSKIVTLANAVSVVRLLAIPVFLWLVIDDRLLVAFILLVAAVLTDFVDGMIARRMNEITKLGQFLGINPERVVMITWLISATLATIAGVLYGLDKGFKPFTYMQLLLPIFAAAIVGGLGNPLGAIAGGFVIAFSEVTVTYAYKKFLTYWLPDAWAPDGLVQLLSTDYKFAVSFVILVLVLLIRPTGIFAGKSV